jgi:GT2 family glycosyltransferase
MSELVSVIIVNWNGRHHLEICLPALMQQTYDNFEIILVDNGSADDSITFVRTHFPKVHLIALDENQGFARGNNIGIASSAAPFVALLNNDTKPAPNWLTDLMNAASIG